MFRTKFLIRFAPFLTLLKLYINNNLKKNHNGFAIALAWPETLCKQAGAWYDDLMDFVGINSKGYYKVGHAAIVLVDGENGECHYFDFGRYHAPHGYGRVRSATTDHDLKIKVKARFSHDKPKIENLSDILCELQKNPSTHGTGTIYGSAIPINFGNAHKFALRLNNIDYIPYGPFVRNGTNCSRFVNSVLQNGVKQLKSKILLRIPWMFTPTPMWNLQAINGKITSIGRATDATSSENISSDMVITA